MKEIMCIIRPNKVSDTKKALTANGFPAFTCRKCSGRGKKSVDTEMLNSVLSMVELPMNAVGEGISEAGRLVAKRCMIIFVNDEDVDKAVQTVIEANQTGNIGDGKIFVLPTVESYRVSSGELCTTID